MPADQPPSPTGLTATGHTDSTIELDWSYAGPPVDSFAIERLQPFGEFGIVGFAYRGATHYIDTHLSSGETDYYRIRAVIGNTNSDPSAVASATTWAVPHGKLGGPALLSFGKVQMGSRKSLTMTLRNAGKTRPVSVSLGSIGPSFAWPLDVPTTFYLAPGAKRVVTITYFPLRKGAERELLILNTCGTPSWRLRV